MSCYLFNLILTSYSQKNYHSRVVPVFTGTGGNPVIHLSLATLYKGSLQDRFVDWIPAFAGMVWFWPDQLGVLDTRR